MVGTPSLPRRSVSGLTAGVVVVVAVVLVAVAQTPARGHAAGQLPTAELSSAGATVRIDLTIARDDAALIGEALGYFREGAMLATLGSGPESELPTDDEIAALSGSAELRDYLEEHVVVRQDGRACDGESFPADDFLLGGASLAFTCHALVEQAEVGITILHDQDRAYRTFSVDGTEQYAIHTVTAPVHTWDFATSVAVGGGPEPVLVAAIVLTCLVAGVVVVVVPRRRRQSR